MEEKKNIKMLRFAKKLNLEFIIKTKVLESWHSL